MQRKSGWEKQKEEEAKEEAGRKQEEKEKKRKQKKEKSIEFKKVGDLGQRRRGSKIRDRGKKAGARKISQVDKGIWEEAVRENADEETVESHDRH